MELYYFLLVILVASILQGITGFGSALVAAPLLFLLVDKTTSVIGLSFVSIALNAFLFFTIKSELDKKIFYKIIGPIMLGLPVGVALLETFSIGSLRILVGVLSIVFAIMLFSDALKPNFSGRSAKFAGFFSGILQTGMGVGGPPVVLYLASQNTEKDEMRKDLSLIFLVTSSASIILFFISGDLTNKSILYGSYAIPAAFLGAFLGNKISKKVSQKQFIVSVFVLIALSIVLAIYSGLKG